MFIPTEIIRFSFFADNLTIKMENIWTYYIKVWWLRWYSTCLQCRKTQFDPCVGKIPWRRKWQPTLLLMMLQYSCQENLKERGDCQAKVHEVTKSWTQLSNWHFHFSQYHSYVKYCWMHNPEGVINSLCHGYIAFIVAWFKENYRTC